MRHDAPLDIATAPRYNSRHWKQSTTTWGDVLAWVDDPGTKKECGNYVLGVVAETTVDHTTDPVKKGCTARHRRIGAVQSRSAITLDVDHAAPGLVDKIEMLLPYAALIHTTYSSSPDDLRYRVIMPTDRPMTPEEYFAVSSVIMEELGWSAFDPGSVQPERYMFLPSTQHREWFQSWIVDGDPVPVAEVFGRFDPDLRRLPSPKPHPNKRNPFELDGVIGAFNRAYGIEEVIEKYELPYEAAGSERWQLVGAMGQAGMGPVSEGLFYSHHVSDPAYGQTCSAFDLVRLHRFGDLDVDVADKTPVNRRPSHQAMMDLAAVDSRVIADLVGLDFDKEMDDVVAGPSDWKLDLRLNPRTGQFLDKIENWDLVTQHDPAFTGLYYNEMTLAVETDTDLPWRALNHGGPMVTDVDRAALCHYLEREYRLRPARGLIDELVATTAQRRFVNPVRDYLDSLRWDGKPRVEECLPGVQPTAYTRLVARKCLVAAVARVYEPGVKADYTMVITGDEGNGKSWWIEKLARGFSATLGDIRSKDTLLTMQRSWIMIADEGYSLRKADADVQKEFLTRTTDVFRLPYERDTLPHPRHCVIWSTTNDDVFLRRQQGNRRFLIVKSEGKVNFDLITEEYIGQLWAEAVHYYRNGERLFLEDAEGAVAAQEREQFTEEDALAGVVEEFLEMLVPEDWDDMGPEQRKMWIMNRNDGFTPAGTKQINRTCSVQIWVEAMGRRFGDHKRTDLLEISTVLKQLPDWEALPGRHRVPHYGPQMVFQRRTEGLL